MKKMITYLVLGCLVVGTGISGFAAEVGNNEQGTQPPAKHEEGSERFENLLDLLVEEGELTEEKVDSILSFTKEKRNDMESQRPEGTQDERPEGMQGQKPEGMRGQRPDGMQGQRPEGMKGQKHGIVEELVEEGIISEEEADAIKEKNDELKTAEREERLNESLDTLIEKGTITEDQKDEMVDFFQDKEEERKAEIEKIKDMSEEERKEYFDEKKEARKDIISEMVEEGIISEEQAEELKELLPKRGGSKGGKRPQIGQRPASEPQN